MAIKLGRHYCHKLLQVEENCTFTYTVLAQTLGGTNVGGTKIGGTKIGGTKIGGTNGVDTQFLPPGFLMYQTVDSLIQDRGLAG